MKTFSLLALLLAPSVFAQSPNPCPPLIQGSFHFQIEGASLSERLVQSNPAITTLTHRPGVYDLEESSIQKSSMNGTIKVHLEPLQQNLAYSETLDLNGLVLLSPHAIQPILNQIKTESLSAPLCVKKASLVLSLEEPITTPLSKYAYPSGKASIEKADLYLELSNGQKFGPISF